MIFLALAVMSAAAAVESPTLQAQARDTLTLVEAVELARVTNPGLLAARLRADASAERVAPAGALPDPGLSFGLMNRPVQDLGRTDQPMTMNNIQFTQRFPWPGKLGFGQERASFLADAESFEADEAEAALIARVKSVYYQIAFIDRALTVMGETRTLLRSFLEVSSARYSVGAGLQQDVLQAQVAVATMTEDITVAEQNRVAMVARLNGLLGRAATVPVEATEFSSFEAPLPDVDSLMGLAAGLRPALQAAHSRAQAAAAGYRAARRAVYPDITVTLGYGQRPEYLDFFTVMVGINIPLWAGRRQLPLRREMTAMQAMEEARALELYNETYARLAELSAEAERARRLSELYATSVIPQARAAVESAFSAYRVGGVDYMTLVQNEMTVNRYEIERLRLHAEFHRAVAQMEALSGARIGGQQ